MTAAVIFGLLSLLAVLLLWPRQELGDVDLRLAGILPTTNGALLVTIVLSNGTSRTFNVVDDAGGKPAFVLDSGGEHGMWLTRMVNQLRINLTPGASLTNTVLITNAPSRFRLKVVLRDLAAERRDWAGMAIHLLPGRLAEQLERRREKPQPSSGWIENKASEP